MTKSTIFKGISAAPGLASGLAFLWQETDLKLPEPYVCSDPEAAWQKIHAAIDQAKQEIGQIRLKAESRLGKSEAAIFDAHLMMVEDVSLLEMVTEALKAGANPEAAWNNSIEAFAGMLEKLSDPLLSARAADVRDVGGRVLAHLLGRPLVENTIESPSIVIARDLTPSQTTLMDHSKVLAFCTSEGGPTSHTAILSKALGIPAIVAMGEAILGISNGDLLLVNSENGTLTCRPSEAQMLEFNRRQAQKSAQASSDLEMAFQPAITRDGFRVEVVANIGSAEDASLAVRYGAEGVGLFRTEFLYLNRSSMLVLNQQVENYSQVIKALQGLPLVVRTLDIGGDKQVDYLGIRKEGNPFLGWRGIRMVFERPEILAEQFRALLLAGRGTDLRIMIPMVARKEEVVRARLILDETLQTVRDEHPSYQVRLQFGIMIEVPSAALIAEHLAPLVDFFSIGTNDLTQYTLAMDRMNARIAPFATPFHPAVLRLIERTITVGHEYGKWVGMCGEFAGEPAAIPFLLGLELDEFSISPASIPLAKRIIRQLSRKDCREIARFALGLAEAGEVEAYLKSILSGMSGLKFDSSIGLVKN